MDELKAREWWTTGECARVLGRGAEFWRAQLDQGAVKGYREESGKRRRYIHADSARALLEGLARPTRPKADFDFEAHWARVKDARMADYRKRNGLEGGAR